MFYHQDQLRCLAPFLNFRAKEKQLCSFLCSKLEIQISLSSCWGRETVEKCAFLEKLLFIIRNFFSYRKMCLLGET